MQDYDLGRKCERLTHAVELGTLLDPSRKTSQDTTDKKVQVVGLSKKTHLREMRGEERPSKIFWVLRKDFLQLGSSGRLRFLWFCVWQMRFLWVCMVVYMVGMGFLNFSWNYF